MEITSKRRAFLTCAVPLVLLVLLSLLQPVCNSALHPGLPVTSAAEVLAQQQSSLLLLDRMTSEARQQHGSVRVTTSQLQVLRQYVVIPR